MSKYNLGFFSNYLPLSYWKIKQKNSETSTFHQTARLNFNYLFHVIICMRLIKSQFRWNLGYKGHLAGTREIHGWIVLKFHEWNTRKNVIFYTYFFVKTKGLYDSMFVLPKIFEFRLGISNLSVGIFLVGLKRILLQVVF